MPFKAKEAQLFSFLKIQNLDYQKAYIVRDFRTKRSKGIAVVDLKDAALAKYLHERQMWFELEDKGFSVTIMKYNHDIRKGNSSSKKNPKLVPKISAKETKETAGSSSDSDPFGKKDTKLGIKTKLARSLEKVKLNHYDQNLRFREFSKYSQNGKIWAIQL